VTVRAACPGDGRALAPLLRAADRAELAAAVGPVEPADALEGALAASGEVLLVESASRPVALFGVSDRSLAGGRAWAKVWMLGTDEIRARPRETLELARAWIPLLCGDAIAWNYIDSRNLVHIRFLQHLGAHVYAHQPTTLHDPDVPFWPFALEPIHVQSSRRIRRYWRRPVRRGLRAGERAVEGSASGLSRDVGAG